MKEYNLLSDYSQTKVKRFVGKGIRNIEHRIIASERGNLFFDGDRNFGYGGLKYDGRWSGVAKKIIKKFDLKDNSKILQLASEKGFLIHEIKKINPKINVSGFETSKYAVSKTIKPVKKLIKKFTSFSDLNLIHSKFDCIIALGVVYIHTLSDAIQLLKNIQRLSKGKSFITLASYETEKDYWLFKDWTVLGSLLYKKEEWKKIMKYAGYKGYYSFTNSKKLNLKRK
jgi:hypothetical protein|tara:strand:+ start:506 stop:1186 length:681 start_codon:yes stop_codon:yes gene_type:complete